MADWIIGGNVYDVAEGAYGRHDIEIADGCVKALVDGAKPGPDDQVVDVDSAYLLPGLIDYHVHLCLPTEAADPSNPWRDSLPGAVALYAAQAARRTLLGGVTTARDVDGWDYHEIVVRDAINKGLIEGPRRTRQGTGP